MVGVHNHGTAIWQGFELDWRRAPHRLNDLTSVIRGRYQPDDDVLECEHIARASVGRVPDWGSVNTWVTGMRSKGLWFVDGEVSVQVGAELGEPAETAAARIHVRVPTRLEGSWTADVLLQGFELSCVSCRVGLHTRGLGLRLRSLKVEPDGVSFIAGFFVHAANSPDLFTWGSGYYVYRMTARYTVVFGPRRRLFCSRGAEDTPDATQRSDGKGAPPVEPVSVRGRSAPDLQRAVLGIRGFQWRQRYEGGRGRDGRFLRNLHAYVDRQDYQPREGVLRFQPRLGFSNRGLIAYAIAPEHQLWTTLLQYADERPVLAHRALHAPIRTGLGRGAAHTERTRLE